MLRSPKTASLLLFCLLLIGMVLVGATSVRASTIGFTDSAAFTTQTGSSLATLPDATALAVTINQVLTITDKSPTGPGQALGTILSGGDLPPYFTLRSNFFGKANTEDFDVTFLAPTYAFGFTVYEPNATPVAGNGCGGTCVDSTFSVTLFSGAVNLGNFSIQPPNDVFGFFGFWSSDPITLIQVRESGGQDNEFFGELRVGSTAMPTDVTAVPEPSSLALLGAGLAGFRFLRRRSSNSRA